MALFSKLLRSTFFRGSILYALSSFAIIVLNYFFNVIVARKLGPAHFGEITALLSYTAIFSVPMIVVLMVLVQKIGSHKQNPELYALQIEQWVLQRIYRWWWLILPLLLLQPLIARITNLSFQSSAAIVPLIILGFLGTYYAGIMQGLHWFNDIAWLALLVAALKLGGPLLTNAHEDGISLIIIFLVVSAIVAVIAPYLLLQRSKKITEKIHGKVVAKDRHLLSTIFTSQMIITFFSIFATTLLGNFDITAAKKFLSPDDVGVYGAWTLFSKLILYSLAPLVTTSFVFFSSKKNQNNHGLVLKISLVILSLVATVSFFVYQFFGDQLIVILFGPKFLSMSSYIGLASLFGAMYTAIALLNNFFLSKKSRYSLLVCGLIIPYTVSCILLGRSIATLIAINLTTSLIVLVVQFVALLQYNNGRWKIKKKTTS